MRNPRNMIYTIPFRYALVANPAQLVIMCVCICVCADFVNDINAICSLIKYFTFQMNRHIAQNDLQCCIDYLLIQPFKLFRYIHITRIVLLISKDMYFSFRLIWFLIFLNRISRSFTLTMLIHIFCEKCERIQINM